MKDTNGKEITLQPKIYRGGLPTKIDVDRLVEHFGVPEIDVLIQWKDVERVLGISKRTCRFGTVVEAWRKRLMENHNIYLEAVSGYGLKAASNPDRVKASAMKLAHGFRKVIKAGDLAASTDTHDLSSEERALRDHTASVGASHRLALKTAARELNFGSAVSK